MLRHSDDLIIENVFTDMHVRVVLTVIEQHMVIVDHMLTFLSVLETRINEESHSLS